MQDRDRRPSEPQGVWVVSHSDENAIPWWIYGMFNTYNEAKDWAYTNLTHFTIHELYDPLDPGDPKLEHPPTAGIHPDQARVEDYVDDVVVR